MARAPRTFSVNPAVRTAAPLFLGLFGPSSSGKTYTALELATGIESVVGGGIALIDTENGRGLAYSDEFAFQHIDFQPPFGSLDYLDAINFAATTCKTIIVDSMSHEHEGPGGMLETHEAEVQRMAGGDWKKAERIKMLAWQKPKQNRRALLNGIIRLDVNLILCFRAKDTSKPKTVKDDNGRTKQEVVHMGFTPIGGDEFVYEMDLAAFLPPGAQGVADWRPDNPGERSMVKVPKQFEVIPQRLDGKPLNREVGAWMAKWSQGGGKKKRDPEQTASQEPQERASPDPGTGQPDEPDRRPPPTAADDAAGYEGA